MIEDIDGVTFDRIRELIRSETGINLKENKKILVTNRLRNRLVALRLSSYEEYYKLLAKKGEAGDEMQYFIDALSTNETYFYRGGDQFEALSSVVLPKLYGTGGRVKIWSAACSTGEEAYTILIVAMETAKLLRWTGTIELTATDINRSVLEEARRGVYKQNALRKLSQSYVKAYFKDLGDDRYAVKDELKKMVIFHSHNLLKDKPLSNAFNIIFCRNVLMYFDRKTQRDIVEEKLAPSLAPDGFLFIGNSESFVGLQSSFVYANINKCPIYRLTTSAGDKK